MQQEMALMLLAAGAGAANVIELCKSSSYWGSHQIALPNSFKQL